MQFLFSITHFQFNYHPLFRYFPQTHFITAPLSTVNSEFQSTKSNLQLPVFKEQVTLLQNTCKFTYPKHGLNSNIYTILSQAKMGCFDDLEYKFSIFRFIVLSSCQQKFLVFAKFVQITQNWHTTADKVCSVRLFATSIIIALILI